MQGQLKNNNHEVKKLGKKYRCPYLEQRGTGRTEGSDGDQLVRQLPPATPDWFQSTQELADNLQVALSLLRAPPSRRLAQVDHGKYVVHYHRNRDLRERP